MNLLPGHVGGVDDVSRASETDKCPPTREALEAERDALEKRLKEIRTQLKALDIAESSRSALERASRSAKCSETAILRERDPNEPVFPLEILILISKALRWNMVNLMLTCRGLYHGLRPVKMKSIFPDAG
jgi:hypothetical protein